MARQDKSRLFRREALKRLDDIDELDHPVTVTHPRAWLALGAVAALIIVALAWASFGRLDTTVTGQGILLTGGRTLTVGTLQGGRLAKLLVDPGDRVTAGETVALVEDASPSAATQAAGAQAVLTSPLAGTVGSSQAVPASSSAPACTCRLLWARPRAAPPPTPAQRPASSVRMHTASRTRPT